MTLFYVPLEAYKERYTMQWSAPKTGWLERRWIENGTPYRRIDGQIPQRPTGIQTGVVLDAVGRSIFAMDQIQTLLLLAEVGEIHEDDVIYFDDFWHPGIEALPYAFSQMASLMFKKPKMFAFLHAQSVDEFDFTYSMKPWIRHFEKGIGAILSGIFTSCPTLGNLIVEGEIAPREKVHVTGHPFASDEVLERMPQFQTKRYNNVVWSSRWDREKRPNFFCDVARRVLDRMPDSMFTVCTGSKELRSNDRMLVERARQMERSYPNRFVVKEDLTKEQYYEILVESKVQFNCALQDFVAISLLEASVAGCYPIYPCFRSFPETFDYQWEYLYHPGSIEDAATKIMETLSRNQNDLWTKDVMYERRWIHTRFDSSWKRQLQIMEGKTYDNPFKSGKRS